MIDGFLSAFSPETLFALGRLVGAVSVLAGTFAVLFTVTAVLGSFTLTVYEVLRRARR